MENQQILRFYAILVIEKNFINEKYSIHHLRHIDYYMFINAAKEVEDCGVNLVGVKDVKKCFHEMYVSWKNRPYQEVQ
jgi:hypothetical protein